MGYTEASDDEILKRQMVRGMTDGKRWVGNLNIENDGIRETYEKAKKLADGYQLYNNGENTPKDKRYKEKGGFEL